MCSNESKDIVIANRSCPFAVVQSCKRLERGVLQLLQRIEFPQWGSRLPDFDFSETLRAHTKILSFVVSVIVFSLLHGRA